MVDEAIASNAAELYVIGAALCYNPMVLDSVSAGDFQDEELEKLFRLIVQHRKEEPPLTHLAELSGLPFTKLAAVANTSYGADIEYYVSELKQASLKRQVHESVRAVTMDLYAKDSKPEAVIESMMSHALRLQAKSVSNETSYVSELLQPYVEADFKRMKGRSVDTGFPLLDRLIDGFQAGSLTYVGARTSMGKTTILLNFAYAALRAQRKVALISMEMMPETIALKLLCTGANVPYKKADQNRLNEFEYVSLKQESANHIYGNCVIESARLTIGKLKAMMRSWVARHGTQIFFIDYLTLIKPDKSSPSRHIEVDQISKGLQDIAKDLGVPVVCASQLNRRIATTNDHKPSLADFRESGSIEEDADTCILLHRPEYYDPKDKPGVMQLIVAKNRLLGDLGTVELVWEGGRYGALSKEVQPIDRAVVVPKPYKEDLWNV